MGFMYGLEYQMSQAESAIGFTGLEEITVKSNTSATGAYIGYDFPILLRVYASYFFDVKTTVDDFTLEFPVPIGTQTITGLEETGTATKIGVSYTGIPFFAINLELMQISIDESSDDSSSSSSEQDKDAQITQITLSLPLP